MQRIKNFWASFSEKHPGLARFLVFFVLSNAVTLLQLIMMPVIKSLFGMTDLINTNFQVFSIGSNLDGSPYYVFNYAAGALSDGGGGGLAYFLAVQISLFVAQVINFFAQRNVTFKASGSIAKAAFWYFIAYIIISVGAAALQGLYKAPIYNLLMNTWGLGNLGETIADVVTMIINSAISFWVFYPIFNVIFKKTSDSTEAAKEA